MSTDERATPQLCCYDGQLTAEPIKVDEVHTSSGAGTDIFACPEHAHLYPAARAAS